MAVIKGTSGADTLNGTDLADTITGLAGDDVLNGQNGDDIIFGNAGTNVLSGGNHDDMIYSNGLRDEIDGGSGNDIVQIGYNAIIGSKVSGGAGTDKLVFENVSISGGWMPSVFSAFEYASGSLIGTGRPDEFSLASLNAWSRYDDARLSLAAGNGDDVITGGLTRDHIQGEMGNDKLFGGRGDLLDGGEGNDILRNSFEDSGTQFFGGAGDDLIDSYDYRDDVDGGAGDDLIVLRNSQEINLVDGGDGIDTVSFSRLIVSGIADFSALSNVELVSGTIEGVLSNDTIDLRSFTRGGTRLNIYGGRGNDALYGGAELDYVVGGLGDDVIFGGDGDDRLADGYGTVSIHGDAGDDWIEVDGAITGFIDGGAGIDLLRSWTAGSPYFSGDVRIVGFEDIIAIRGSDGNDRLDLTESSGDWLVDLEVYGGGGDDQILGDGGRDELFGEAGDDVIDGADTIQGGAGTNSLYGGSGDDRIFSAGYDRIDAGDGDDSVDVSQANGLTITGGNGFDELYFDQVAFTGVFDGSRIVGFEDLTGSLLGGAGDDVFDPTALSIAWPAVVKSTFSVSGGDGNDYLAAIGSLVWIDGDEGNDRLASGQWTDLIYGGNGEDTVIYELAAAGVNIDLRATWAQDTRGAGVDTLREIENIVGSDFNDILVGDINVNVIEGGLGDDMLDGGAGSDVASYASSIAAITVSLALTGAQNSGGAGTDTLLNLENLVGSAFDDSLTGNIGANHLGGAAGDDTLSGGDGDDILMGGTGNDTLNGGAGLDAASYADAADAVQVSLATTGPQMTGGGGTDTLIGIERLIGSAFDDILTGGAGAGVLDGGNGLDMVSFATARSAVIANFATGDVPGSGGGTDTLISIEGAVGSAYTDTLTGDAGANRFDGGAGNDVIDGGAGDDLIDGGVGTDRLIGGAGVDTLTYANATARVIVNLSLTTAQNTLGAGNDTQSGFENLTGSAYGDTLTGTGYANRIEGGLGNDVIIGLAGNDVLTGGTGDDTLSGGAGNDSLDGGAGTDVASYADATSGVTVSLLMVIAQNTGGSDKDTLTGIEGLIGSAFDDVLIGNVGNNSLNAGFGNDRISGDLGNDIIDGGSGIDTIDYALVGAGVTVDLSKSWAQNTGGAGTDTIRAVENVIGTAFDDVLTGNEYGNALTGGGGNDVLVGNLGNDVLAGGAGIDTANYVNATAGVRVSLALTGQQSTLGAGGDTLSGIENLTGSAFDDQLTGDAGDNVLTGNAGNDTLSGGAGNDILSGGAGVDTASYAAVTAGVTVSLLVAAAQNTGGAGTDTLSSMENLVGSAYADTLTGNAQANLITGGNGDDVIDGGSGADTLEGGNGNDLIKGAAGDDILIGGAGRDTLTGGAGNDRFVYQTIVQSPASSNADRITDFTAGDILDLSAIDASTTLAGDQGFVRVAAFTGTAGQLTLAFDSTTNTTTLRGDTDGNGVADLTILFTGNAINAVAASWVL